LGVLLGAFGLLAVALDHDDVVVLIQAHVHGLTVGLGDLDLPGRAVLRVTLDRVGVATGRIQRGRDCPVGLGALDGLGLVALLGVVALGVRGFSASPPCSVPSGASAASPPCSLLSGASAGDSLEPPPVAPRQRAGGDLARKVGEVALRQPRPRALPE